MSTVVLDRVVLRPSRRASVGPISAVLEPSTLLALLGPNGSGKTTLLRGLVGLTRFSEGSATVDGERVRAGVLPAGVGAILEEPRFLDWLTCSQNLSVSGENRSDDDVNGALARWGLAGAADQAVRELSQGMRQRLGLARLDLACPRVLLLDEPTNALDVVWQERLWDFVAARRNEGAVLIITSHDLDAVVSGGATRIFVLSDGILAADFDIGPDGCTNQGVDARDAARRAVMGLT